MIYLVLARLTCCQSLKQKLSKSLFWGVFLRILKETYIEIGFSAMVSLAKAISWKNQSQEFRNSLLYNNGFTIFIAAMFFGFPFFIHFFYSANLNKLQREKFKTKYGELLEGLYLLPDLPDTEFNPKQQKRIDKRKRVALFYPFWFITRRVLFVFTVMLFTSNPVPVMSVLTVSSLV